MVLEIEKVVYDVKAGNISEIDRPDAVDVVWVVVVVPNWRGDGLVLGDRSSAGFDGSREGGKGGEELKYKLETSFNDFFSFRKLLKNLPSSLFVFFFEYDDHSSCDEKNIIFATSSWCQRTTLESSSATKLYVRAPVALTRCCNCTANFHFEATKRLVTFFQFVLRIRN